MVVPEVASEDLDRDAAHAVRFASAHRADGHWAVSGGNRSADEAARPVEQRIHQPEAGALHSVDRGPLLYPAARYQEDHPVSLAELHDLGQRLQRHVRSPRRAYPEPFFLKRRKLHAHRPGIRDVAVHCCSSGASAQKPAVVRTTLYGRPMLRKCRRARYSPMMPRASNCAPEKRAIVDARKGKPGTLPWSKKRPTT